MAMFAKGKEEKEEKREAKEREIMEKYGLQYLNSIEDIETVRGIASELASSGMVNYKSVISELSAYDVLRQQMCYQRAIVEQNFMIIRQLDRIASKLSK